MSTEGTETTVVTQVETPPAAPQTPQTPPPAETPKPPEQPKPDAPKPDEKTDPSKPVLGEETKQGELELKLPEGVEVDPALVEGIKAIVKEHGLKPEAAQKFAELQIATQQRAAQQEQERIKATAEQWGQAVRTDKEWGGEKFEASKAAALRFLRQFGDPRIQEFLNGPLGSHPGFFATFAKAGMALAEDSVAGTTGATGAPSNRAKSPEDVYRTMYPTMYQES